MMDKEAFLKYAPWLAVAMAFFMQYNLFVTPAQLEKTHREVLEEVKADYASKEVMNRLETQFNSMNYKIDEIYKMLNKKGGL